MAVVLQTPNDVIRRGIALTSIHPDEEEMPANYITDALHILNDILDEWSGYGVIIPYQSKVTFNCKTGQSTYSISSTLRADINDYEIVNILEANIFEEELNWPLDIYSESNWGRTSDRQSSGKPGSILLRRYNHFCELILYPVPDKVYKIELICKQRLAEVDLNEPFDEVPPHYLRVLAYQIALDFAATMDVRLNPHIERKAEKLVENLLASNVPDLSVRTPGMFSGGGRCL